MKRQNYLYIKYNIVYLFAILSRSFIYYIQAETGIEYQEVKSISCQTQEVLRSRDLKNSLTCSVNITYEYYEKFANFSCDLVRPNSLLVVVAQHNVINNTIICVSNSPIFVKVDSEKSDEDVLQMQWHRKVDDFNNTTTYIYELHIDPPSQNKIRSQKAVVAVRYNIFSNYNPQKQIHILWFFDDLSSLAFLDDKLVNNTIVATDEIVNIPCVYRDPKKARIFLRSQQINDTANRVPRFIPIDNKSLSYNPIHGFTINISKFVNHQEQFGCKKVEVYEKSKYFTITRPDIATTSQFHHLGLTPPVYETPFVYSGCDNKGFTYITDFHQSEFDLKCTNIKTNVTFSIREKNNSTRQLKDIFHSLNDKSKKTYSAMITTPKINETLEIQCQDASTSTVFHEWKLINAFSRTVTYDPLTNTLKCSATNDNIIFKQIECNGRFSCRESAPALFESDSLATKIHLGSACKMQSNEHNKKCKSLNILKKGYFQCTTTKGNNKTMGINPCLSKLVYQDIYFLGFDNKLYLGNVEPPNSAIMKMELVTNTDRDLILPGDYKFYCETHSFYFEHGIQWFVVYHNNTRRILPQGNVTDVARIDSQDNFANVNRFSIIHLEDSSIWKIMCASPLMSILNDKNGSKWKYISTELTLKYLMPPVINNNKADEVNYFHVGSTNQTLVCHVTGFPKPEITWTYKSRRIEAPLLTIAGVDYATLIFPVYKQNFAGKYICTARNKMGVTRETFFVQTAYVEIQSLTTAKTFANVEIEISFMDAKTSFTIVLSLCILAIILPMLAMYCWMRTQRKKQLSEDIRKFVEGNSSQSEINENSALLLPYNEHYEILRSQFEIDTKTVLGKGAFGIVYKGRVSTVNYQGYVALKTLKPYSRPEKFNALLKELKVMIYVGHHENIVRLVAAYTKELQNGIVYIATELCSLGSLEQYLRRSNKEMVCTSRAGSSNQERFQDKQQLKKLSREKLCDWSAQIANGMEYLGSKHVVHSDLATRNILLNSEEVVKITDFDLSHHMYNYINYAKKDGTKDPLPWKWMAIESLNLLTYSTQTDVWAYGITLWEIFSLGAVPYPGISWTIDFVEMLENGLRNPKPKLANTKIYKVMSSCWSKYPLERPSFNSLKTFFMHLSTTQEYLEDEPEVLEDKEGYLIPSQPDVTIQM